MCRFIAYIGATPRILGSLLTDPENSLIRQSKKAKESGTTGLNADGFGISWYQREIDEKPALFKSINPAWGDYNIEFLAKKTSSQCFLGHVRAATVGDVYLHNCHPFAFGNYSFVHNGTLKHFNIIRRDLLNLLDDDIFDMIKGKTDSEHIFALLMQNIKDGAPSLEKAFTLMIKQVQQLQKNHNHQCLSRINTVLTDGKSMMVTRYLSDKTEKPISLYYNTSESGVIIASEPLNDAESSWSEVPLNSIMVIAPDLSITIDYLTTE